MNRYHYDRGRGPIWLTNVGCNGSETFIGDCFHLEWGSDRCYDRGPVYIACTNLTTPSSHGIRLNYRAQTCDDGLLMLMGALDHFTNIFPITVCIHTFIRLMDSRKQKDIRLNYRVQTCDDDVLMTMGAVVYLTNIFRIVSYDIQSKLKIHSGLLDKTTKMNVSTSRDAHIIRALLALQI